MTPSSLLALRLVLAKPATVEACCVIPLSSLVGLNACAAPSPFQGCQPVAGGLGCEGGEPGATNDVAGTSSGRAGAQSPLKFALTDARRSSRRAALSFAR